MPESKSFVTEVMELLDSAQDVAFAGAHDNAEEIRSAYARKVDAFIKKYGAIVRRDQKNMEGQHDLYVTGDADAPDVIKDSNGHVCLDLCRKCGKGEIELCEPCGPRLTWDQIVTLTHKRAQALVWLAGYAGLVVEIRQEPRKPLAMGNSFPVVDVRVHNSVYRGRVKWEGPL